MAFVEDTTLAKSLSHNGEVPNEDEELIPTLVNFIFLTWLSQVKPDLPKLVKTLPN